MYLSIFSIADRLVCFVIQGKSADDIYSDEMKRNEAKKAVLEKSLRRYDVAMHRNRMDKQSTSSRKFEIALKSKASHVRRQLSFEDQK